MVEVSASALQAHRLSTFRQGAGLSVTSPEDAQEWINERGFVYFWPIKGVIMPNLWSAVAGDRPVADAHDDPGHITWGWKDFALGKGLWYYAKVLRKKATMISLEIAPYFYALSENYGSPEEDHLIMYREGRLTLAAKQVYEALLKEGALNTIDLRRASHLTSKQSDTEFNRALELLQADFKILPVGIAEAGAWKYAHIYDITAHHLPDLPEQARTIGEAEARLRLVRLYFASIGAAELRDVTRLFGWGAEICGRVTRLLVESGELVHANLHSREHLALPGLVDV